MTVSEFHNAGLDVPVGVITVWPEKATNVPPGWLFCDGNNGTPDLRNKHVRCVPDTATDPGATGGSNVKSLSTSQLPSHTHSVSISTAGDHTHTLTNSFHSDNTNISIKTPDPNGGTSATSPTAGSHSHSVNDSNAGSGSDIENEPAHQTVAFIQKA